MGLFATKARKDGDSYVLNGRKTFTSLSPVIDLFMVMATLEDSNPPRASTFLIPKGTAGLELIETWDAMGMRATASHDLVIKDVVVPAIAMAESRPIGPIDAASVSLFTWFWLSVAAVYTGIAIAAFKFVKEFTGRFKPMALPRPIKYLPGIQFAAADAQALLAQSRTFYVETAREYVANPERSFAGEGGLARVVLAKYIATNNAIRAVDLMMEIVGAHGYLKKFPMERYFRDVRAGVNHPLSNARARELIGKNAAGHRARRTPALVDLTPAPSPAGKGSRTGFVSVDDIEQVALRAARAAGRIHLRWLNKTRTTRKSNALDLVTEADKEAEAIIIASIRRAFPSHAILAEESGASAQKSEHRWIIDPLDGTTNFAHGFPAFCVSIAYEYRGRVAIRRGLRCIA